MKFAFTFPESVATKLTNLIPNFIQSGNNSEKLKGTHCNYLNAFFAEFHSNLPRSNDNTDGSSSGLLAKYDSPSLF